MTQEQYEKGKGLKREIEMFKKIENWIREGEIYVRGEYAPRDSAVALPEEMKRMIEYVCITKIKKLEDEFGEL